MGFRGRQIIASFEIVTPMFIGGGDPTNAESPPRLRETSLRGALAFWWRAIHYAPMLKRYGKEEVQAKLHERETELFGSEKGQGLFSLSVRVRGGVLKTVEIDDILRQDGTVTKEALQPKAATNVLGEGVRYLGFGLMDAFDTNTGKPEQRFGGQLTRPAIKACESFNLHIRWNDARVPMPMSGLGPIGEIVTAVRVLGLLGGLGSRVRRGFGSLVLTRLSGNIPAGTDISIPDTVSAYELAVATLFKRAAAADINKIPITAFGAGARALIVSQSSSPFERALDALDHIGLAFLRYRGNGRSGKSNKAMLDRSFQDDHDWFRAKNRFAKGYGNYVPQRSAFGLPHNYGNGFNVRGWKRDNGRDMVDINRRASPLFFHIHKIGSSFHPVLLFLPTEFLPTKAVSVATGGTFTKKEFDFDDYSYIIDDFLDGKKHRDTEEPKCMASPPYFHVLAEVPEKSAP